MFLEVKVGKREKSKAPADIEERAREYDEIALRKLAAIVERDDLDALGMRAAEVLLDRGWGKARRNPVRETVPVAPIRRIKWVIVDPVRDKQAEKEVQRA